MLTGEPCHITTLIGFMYWIRIEMEILYQLFLEFKLLIQKAKNKNSVVKLYDDLGELDLNLSKLEEIVNEFQIEFTAKIYTGNVVDPIIETYYKNLSLMRD